ncbi:PHP domain-containing protein [Rothia sp. ZJ932]|uniref:PHP domain-containing protein n=1 Tax=Rothia sp. ZJ932 TaxID=2810516 RepID=UPI0019676DBF|nr:PHP domain-containing protein [Rothia sp. ZJ932]QRZ62212.1 PHP domain-containing protein [Rothia sp. ZJ932]
MAYDLHTHSALSDGTQTVDELVGEIAGTGLTGFALTDHDTCVGWTRAAELADVYGLDFVPGMEVSCATSGLSVHLLSYYHDPENTDLFAEINLARDSRITRAQKMVDLIAVDYPVTWDLVQEHVGEEATVGRPHIADALVTAGCVSTRSEAFATILTPASPYYVSHYAVDPVKAVKLVRAAGGVPVMAHPFARSRGRVASVELLEQMIDAGLCGLEINHRDNAEDDRAVLRVLAQKHDLIVTGASDYHGAGKPNRLGENTTTGQMVERIRERAGL